MKCCKKKIVWNVLRNIDCKTIKKFCDIIICGLHFDRTLRINYEMIRWKILWSVMLKHIIEYIHLPKAMTKGQKTVIR